MVGPLTFIDVDDRTIAYLTVGGRHTEDLRRWCPGFPDWCNAHLWRNLSGRYRVIRALTSDVRMGGRGFVILDMRARRIVSLFVYAPYRRQGVGTALMRRALGVLGTPRPGICVPKALLGDWSPLLDRFGFERTYDSPRDDDGVDVHFNESSQVGL